MCFSSMVQSLLSKDILLRTYVKLCKFLMGVNKRAVNLSVNGELWCFPFGISCMLKAFKYLYHIQSSSNILLQEALAISQNLH